MPVLAAAIGAALLAIAALHLTWAVTPWPLPTVADLARDVVGRSDGSLRRAVFVPATVAVAAALTVAAWLVALHGEVLSSPLSDDITRAGTWGVAIVLLGRGALGLAEAGSGRGDRPPSYRRLNLRIYSPLCLVLGAATATVALA
ncbi:DUF3995 domain-containing protein [Nocardioides sp. LHD-245]|uniref:DUF3995 domain-containing protein n=1 Tax=Nocardioides sp. LHD-245 TaxID=3051387 RepID=UPI0027DEFAE7|nr:DUF3995 domain-containing protein [Nocardioides sp. LHD-245]